MDYGPCNHALSTMNNLTLTEIATLYPSAIVILNDNNLDFCCNGNLTFVEACKKQNIDAGTLFHQIKNEDAAGERYTSFEGWDFPLLLSLFWNKANIDDMLPSIIRIVYDLKKQTAGKLCRSLKRSTASLSPLQIS